MASLPEQYQPMIMALESSGIVITRVISVKTNLLQESSYLEKLKSTTDNDAAYYVKWHTRGAKLKSD